VKTRRCKGYSEDKIWCIARIEIPYDARIFYGHPGIRVRVPKTKAVYK
jgi:hypothetical protein